MCKIRKLLEIWAPVTLYGVLERASLLPQIGPCGPVLSTNDQIDRLPNEMPTLETATTSALKTVFYNYFYQ